MNASEFGCGAGHQLAITAAKAGWEIEDFTILTQSEKKCREVLLFLRGEAELVIKPKPASVPEVEIDPIIRVDRSIRPSYPHWVKMVMHPELEDKGPAEYDISVVEQWLHDGQKDGKRVKGNEIYDHLKKTDTLKICLGLRDLEEIQKKGITFFRKHFKGKAVFGWAGIVRDSGGHLLVPDLYEDDDEVVLSWYWTDGDWDDYRPALRFANSTQA